MTRIGLISDTHGYLDERVYEHFKQCDELWHAGDIGTTEVTDALKAFKPLRAVFGNIDGKELRAEFPLDNIFELEGMKVYITHIGGYPGRYNVHAREMIEQHRPGLFVCGHSHILKVMRDKKYGNMLCMNPGAAGHHGFHPIRTLLRFGIDAGKVVEPEAIELGKRGKLR